MAFLHDMREEKAMVSIDFLTGVGVLLMAFLFASYTISSVMTPYSGYSKELYPAADRAATLLVRDPGYWTDGNDYGTEWNAVWDDNQSYVRKIGLVKSDGNNLIDSRKLNVFMQNHSGIEEDISWWEYPTSSTEPEELENVSRALGLGRNNFYIQIRPVNESLINVSKANAAAIDAVGEQSDVVAVARLATTEHTTFGQFDGADLLGHVSPTKILIMIEPEDFDLITNGITFSISNWIFGDGTNESVYQWIKMGDEISASYELKDSKKLKEGNYTVCKNGVNVTDSVAFSFNKTDTLGFFIPKSTLDYSLPEMCTSGNAVFLQLNVNSNVEIKDDGYTLFCSSKKTKGYPVKMTLWTW
jgi:hypothetical protein